MPPIELIVGSISEIKAITISGTDLIGSSTSLKKNEFADDLLK